MAPITGVLVLLIPGITHTSPVLSAVDRVLEVAVGGATGLIVSFVVFPSTAHLLFVAATARVLDQMARALELLLGEAGPRLDQDALDRLQDDLLQAVVQLSAVNYEAEHERTLRFTRGAETGPLLGTIARLRHDLVMIGRAVSKPPSPDIEAHVEASVAQTGKAFASYLRTCGNALLQRRKPPSLDPINLALHSYAEEVAAVRREQSTLNLSGDAAERFFAFSFAFEQMYQHVQDLCRCVHEWAGNNPYPHH